MVRILALMEKKILNLYFSKLYPTKKIAKELNIASASVRNVIIRKGLKLRSNSESKILQNKFSDYGTTSCVICNRPFNKKQHNQKFCSLKCRRVYYYEKNSKLIGRVKLKNISRVCPTCGKKFDVKAANQIYCSKKCWIPKKNICKICGLEKEIYGKGMCRICWKRQWRLKRNPPKNKICKNCSKEYKSRYPNNIFCSKKCKEYFHARTDATKEYNRLYRESGRANVIHKKWRLRNPDKFKEITKRYDKSEKGRLSRLKRDRRRENLIQKDIFSLTINDVRKILNRDTDCVYCGSKENLSWEHIIPVSKGGRWEFNNIVRACMKCQTERGNKDVNRWCSNKNIPVPDIIKKLLVKQREQKRLV